ncbi:uncharacterized protein LOC131640724 [Vicia villosa]|uniref:uncharacterized protein LOC131640724 n=1 Tax=Vicia villosa TaxID=3911 RepID=UPI00273AE2D1|nr:uncharacterized protein LOC131640724 [Vicia villosa]
MAPITRKFIKINFVSVPTELKELVLEVPRNSRFVERHGCLLRLVSSDFEEDMMRVLFQFFDPTHHCFTFPDYQLVPTLEEFSELLCLPIRDQVPFTGLEEVPKSEVMASALHIEKSEVESNWETKSGVKGFLAKFLLKKARSFLKAMSYQAFEDVLALLIYGLVLFPNPDQFVDVHAVTLFLARNPVPTLLGDILHSLYTRTDKKRGTLMCCIPLLSRWFISHLPRSVLRNEQRMQWSQRMMSLSHSDIHWYTRSDKDFTIIDRCGEFPNVPLLGIRGDDPQNYRRSFIRAWEKVYKYDSKELGQKNSIPLEPYLRWVRIRAQKCIMPYPAVRPVIIEPEFEGDAPQAKKMNPLEQSVKDLQVQNAEFQALILSLDKGQEELKTLLTKKEKKAKKPVGVLNMGRRFRGPLKKAKEVEIPEETEQEEGASGKTDQTSNNGSGKQDEEEEDYYEDEEYPEDKYR